MRALIGGSLILASVALAAPAKPDWYRASSEHFVIYAEQKPDKLRKFAEELERFDQAVRYIRSMDNLPVSKGNRLTVFALPYGDKVQKLIGDKNHIVAGFYRGRVAGSVAFISPGSSNKFKNDAPTGTNIARSSNLDLQADTILLHEYSHHLMMQDLARPYPQWLVEGFAEYMSTAKFGSDGSVGIGLPATHRYAGLLLLHQMPLETLLSGKYDKITLEDLESIYGRGWLLTHFLTSERSRTGQLDSYITALAHGTDSVAAARQSFGDLKKLEADLDDYLHRSKLRFWTVSSEALKVGPVELTRLSDGASAALPLVMELENGPNATEGAELAAKLGVLEQRFPGDPFVETALAEAKLDAEDFAGAEVVADRALAADPGSAEAMILKGRAQIEQLVKSRGPAAGFTQARNWFLKANKVDPEDPEPLYEFYHSFVRQGLEPNQNAIDALHYASDLAPQDTQVRLMSAGQYLIDGKVKQARAALVPIAYDPHGANATATARKMIERIDAVDVKGALKAGGWTFSSTGS